MENKVQGAVRCSLMNACAGEAHLACRAVSMGCPGVAWKGSGDIGRDSALRRRWGRCCWIKSETMPRIVCYIGRMLKIVERTFITKSFIRSHLHMYIFGTFDRMEKGVRRGLTQTLAEDIRVAPAVVPTGLRRVPGSLREDQPPDLGQVRELCLERRGTPRILPLGLHAQPVDRRRPCVVVVVRDFVLVNVGEGRERLHVREVECTRRG